MVSPESRTAVEGMRGRGYSIGKNIENSYTGQRVTLFCWKVGLVPTFCFWLMYKQNAELLRLIAPVIQDMGYELWGIEHLPRGRAALLRIYIDSETGISLADCEKVSRQVTGVLDVKDPIRGSYDLEISSPGLDRPLFTLEQVTRYRGEQAKFRLRSNLEGRRNIKGEIKAVDGDVIKILEGEELLSVPASLIEKANILR